jgi:hypothetical protein
MARRLDNSDRTVMERLDYDLTSLAAELRVILALERTPSVDKAAIRALEFGELARARLEELKTVLAHIHRLST